MGDIVALVKRRNDAFNRRDVAGARALMAEEVRVRAPGMPEATGREAALAFDQVWWDACSDAHSEIREIAVSGSTALQSGVFTGTHDGVLRTPMGEIQATGRRIVGDYVWRFRFDGDEVVEAQILFDRMQVMEQIGKVPETARA